MRDVVQHEYLDIKFRVSFFHLISGSDTISMRPAARAVEVDTRSLRAYVECGLCRVLAVKSGKSRVSLKRVTEMIGKVCTCSS